MSIYLYGSRESCQHDFFPTQGNNESYSHFTCRVSGFQTKWAEPDQSVRQMIERPAYAVSGDFSTRVASVSVAKAEATPPLFSENMFSRQICEFAMRKHASNNVCCRGEKNTTRPLIEQSERFSPEREAEYKPKENLFQRALKAITRCFIPCIKIENRI